MYYKEINLSIRQLIPVQECITPLQYFPDENCFHDASGKVFYALMEDQYDDDQTALYTFDDFGLSSFILQYRIIFARTIHCKRCGQRMKIADIPYKNFQGLPVNLNLTYTCPCGMKYHTKFTESSDIGKWEE